jgi:hypothetical protein
MMTNIALLRQAIKYCRDNPNLYNQSEFYSQGQACVIGRAIILSNEFTIIDDEWIRDNSTGEEVDSFDVMTKKWGFSVYDYSYMFNSERTLDEIEQRVNEIEIRENPPLVHDDGPVVTIRISGTDHIISADSLIMQAFIAGARAANPDVRIVKVTEEVL